MEYSVTRPTAARVVNEDTYSFGVVTYDNNGVVVFVEGESPDTLWPGMHNKNDCLFFLRILVSNAELIYCPTDGVTPYDGTPNDVVEGTHSAVTVVFTLLASLGLLFTVACLVFNAAFKNKKYNAPFNTKYIHITSLCVLQISEAWQS